jgi:hypothetical protein
MTVTGAYYTDTGFNTLQGCSLVDGAGTVLAAFRDYYAINASINAKTVPFALQFVLNAPNGLAGTTYYKLRCQAGSSSAYTRFNAFGSTATVTVVRYPITS